MAQLWMEGSRMDAKKRQAFQETMLEGHTDAVSKAMKQRYDHYTSKQDRALAEL